MKKGEIYEGIIEKVDFPNKGYVNIDGEKVIVKNGIPGQKVRFMINKKRSGRAEGRLLEILENSTLEVREPVCKIFPACGGCMYQTMSYEEQLKMKETQVKGLLQEAVGIGTDLHWEGIHGSPIEFGYRNKMEFSFGDEYKDGPLSLGLHKKGSTYDVLTASDCKLVHPDMTAILSSVLDFFTELGAVHYKKMQHTGYLRHLLLRRGVTSGEILVHVITTNQAEYDYAPLVSRLLALPLEGKIVGIMHIINDSLSDVVQSDETRLLYGQDYFYETLLGLRFKISTFSFFQPNSLAAEVLYSIVRDYIGDIKDKEVFDLYSGTGTIAQLLASVAKEVIGVEIVEEAVEAAKVNAALNGLTNCRFIAGDVLKVLDNLTEKPDMIILDLGLPDGDGIEIIKNVREISKIPIIVVSARQEEEEKIQALDLGADDYVTKPFYMGELLARIRVALRKSNQIPEEKKEKIFQCDYLKVDWEKHQVSIDGKEVHLTPMEYKILKLLIDNRGKVLTHNYILSQIWGSAQGVEAANLRVFMAALRRKIEKDPGNCRFILTEIGVGYRFREATE